MTSKDRTRIRTHVDWKKFREQLGKERKVDQVTLSRLSKKPAWNCHHLDPRNYEDFFPEKFACLNSTTHKMVEWGYTYYKKDRAFIDRLKKIWDDMLYYEE